MRERSWGVLVVVGLSMLAGARASAQDSAERWTMAPRLYAQGQLGLFGDVHLHSDNVSGTDSLEPSGGAVLGFEIPLAAVFSIGAEAGGWAWNSDRGDSYDIGSSFLGDLSIVPRLRMPWSTGNGPHGAVGIALPIGPTLSVLSEDIQDGLSHLGASANAGYGLNVGAMVNGQFFIVPAFGFTFDVGYQHHFMWHDVRGTFGDTHQVQLDMGQLVMRAGIIVAL